MMSTLEILKHKLNNPTLDDIQLTLALEETEQAIMNYCNIDEVPEALRFTHVNLAFDLLKYQIALNSDEDIDPDISNVSSIRVGDTTINLGSNSTQKTQALKSHKANLDDLVLNYKDQLNRFRRMVWY